MERKKYNIINKLLVVIIVCLLGAMQMTAWAIDTIPVPNDLRDLMEKLSPFIDTPELGEKIIEFTGNDLNLMRRLQSNYHDDTGFPFWSGGNPTSPTGGAVDAAIRGDVIVVDKSEKDKILSDAAALYNSIYRDPNSSQTDWENCDTLLQNYLAAGGSLNDPNVRDMVDHVSAKLKDFGKTEETAGDKVDKSEEEREEYKEASKPSTGTLGTSSASTSHTPDEIITEANQFIEQASGTTISDDQLNSASSTLYNILLSIGIFLSVAIGMYLGVKFMVSTAEEKAKVKEALIPYIAGCIVIFSAFIIWKFVILLLAGIA